MKTKTYVITTGDYSSYMVDCIVVGPVKPALSTLYNEFREKYNFPNWNKFNMESLASYDEWYKRKCDSQAAAELDGLKQYVDLPQFVQWIIKEKDFSIADKADVGEFHVER